MSGIRIENGTILFYGNAAGYVSQGRAVVDPMFQGDELSAFLDRQREVKEVKWTDGVFDRLMSGQKETREIQLLKNCRVWQLKPDVDIGMKFIGYDEMLKRYGPPDPANYQMVYDGEVDTNDLEGLYAKFNADERPTGYTGYSLSMSDVLELYDDAGSEFHYVDRFSFKQVDFTPSGQTMCQSMQL